jgi:hypothetical protein
LYSFDECSFGAKTTISGVLPVPASLLSGASLANDDVSMLRPAANLLASIKKSVAHDFDRSLIKKAFAELALVYGANPSLLDKCRDFLVRSQIFAVQEWELFYGNKEYEWTAGVPAASLKNVPAFASQLLKDSSKKRDPTPLAFAFLFTQMWREFQPMLGDRLDTNLKLMHAFMRENFPLYERSCSDVYDPKRLSEEGFLCGVWHAIDDSSKLLAKSARDYSVLELERRKKHGHDDYVPGISLIFTVNRRDAGGQLCSYVRRKQCALPDVKEALYLVRRWRAAAISSAAGPGSASQINDPQWTQKILSALVECFSVCLKPQVTWTLPADFWTEQRILALEDLLDVDRGCNIVDKVFVDALFSNLVSLS